MRSRLMTPVFVGFFRIPVFPKDGWDVGQLVKNVNNPGSSAFTRPSIGNIAGGMAAQILPQTIVVGYANDIEAVFISL